MGFIIDSEVRLRTQLKIFKHKCKKQGLDPLLYYPAFCDYYSKHKDTYELSDGVVLEMACEVLIEDVE